MQLLEDYKPDAAGGLLDRLALSANCSGAEGLSGDSEDVEMEGRGAWSTSVLIALAAFFALFTLAALASLVALLALVAFCFLLLL